MNSYDNWKLQGDRDHDDPEGEDQLDEPVRRCRACDGILDDDPDQYIYWNGWFWCVDHGKQMQRMAMSPDAMNEVRR